MAAGGGCCGMMDEAEVGGGERLWRRMYIVFSVC